MTAEEHAKVWQKVADMMMVHAADKTVDGQDRLAMANLGLLAQCVSTAYHNEAP